MLSKISVNPVLKPRKRPMLRAFGVISGCIGVLFVGGSLAVVAFGIMLTYGETKRFSYVIPANEAVWKTYKADKLGIMLSYPVSTKYPNEYTPVDLQYDELTLTEDGVTDMFDPNGQDNIQSEGSSWKFHSVRFKAFEILWNVDRIYDKTTPCVVGGREALCYSGSKTTDLVRNFYTGYVFDYKGQNLTIVFYGDNEMNETEQAIINSLQFTETE